MFDELANQIGWVVIFGLGFYAIGKVIIALGEEQKQKEEFDLNVWDHERRLAFRRIWRLGGNEDLINQIKNQYGPWALLDPSLNDDEYNKKMQSSTGYREYLEAVRRVEAQGYPYVVSNGKICIGRSDVLDELDFPRTSNFDLNKSSQVIVVSPRTVVPSPQLATVIGEGPVTRTEAIKKIWAYIKANGLQDADNERVINADAKLRAVFGKDQVTMFELTGIVGKHLG